MLHHAEARHVQIGFELGERAAVTREELVEQEATRPIGERFEYAILVRHDETICD